MKLSLAQVAIKYGTKVQFVSAISLLRSKFFFYCAPYYCGIFSRRADIVTERG